MTIIFLSNYFNHHQKPISDKFKTLTGNNYLFIETSEMDDERTTLGWGMVRHPDYVIANHKLQQNKSYYLSLIDSADVVIFGSAPSLYVRNRIKSGKLTFLYSERIYKKRWQILQLPLRALVYYLRGYYYKNVYLLCASAYAASDYGITGYFKNRSFKWGYFPETKIYDIDALMEQKHNPVPQLLWVGRFLALKHPELPIEVARRLKADGYTFQLNMIGIGELQSVIQQQIDRLHLGDCVHLLGAMKPEQVRHYMEKSSIFMFTSDRNEGWGAVLNEAMNSGCAVVANKDIGSVPFLITHGHNGFIYINNSIDILYTNVKLLIKNKNICINIGINAYKTIVNIWNAHNAASNFMNFSNNILEDKKYAIFKNEPCGNIPW